MKRSPMPPRRTPLRQVGRKALREMAALRDFRQQVRVRAGGMCQGATPACPTHAHPGTDAHHLSSADRDRGNHDPARGVLLCRQAHAFVHANPEWAYARRLLLRGGS